MDIEQAYEVYAGLDNPVLKTAMRLTKAKPISGTLFYSIQYFGRE